MLYYLTMHTFSKNLCKACVMLEESDQPKRKEVYKLTLGKWANAETKCVEKIWALLNLFESLWWNSSKSPGKCTKRSLKASLSQSSCFDVGWFFKILEFDSELASSYSDFLHVRVVEKVLINFTSAVHLHWRELLRSIQVYYQ